MKKIACLFSLLFAVSMIALAAEPAAIKAEHPWARETPPTVTTGAAYMTLVNQSNQADRLLSAAGEVATTIELHTHVQEGDMMKMRPVEAIEVKPGEPAVLEPGGLHIMLIGLKQPLVEGQRFKLLLNFEKAGKVPVEVQVTKTDPAHEGHKEHKEHTEHSGGMHKP